MNLFTQNPPQKNGAMFSLATRTLLAGFVWLTLASCGGGHMPNVSMVCTTCVNEGTTGVGGPIALTQGVTHSGTVAPSGFSYYQVSYASAMNHTITLNGLSANADMTSYSDVNFTTPFGACPVNGANSPETCTVTTTAAGQTVYLRVNDVSGLGVSYTVAP